MEVGAQSLAGVTADRIRLSSGEKTVGYISFKGRSPIYTLSTGFDSGKPKSECKDNPFNEAFMDSPIKIRPIPHCFFNINYFSFYS